ncbi:hypothetical protein MRX96_017041 [Rhipicephalus microplus]
MPLLDRLPSISYSSEPLCQTRSEASLAFQIRKPKTFMVLVTSVVFIGLLFVAVGLALRPQERNQMDIDVSHPATSRLFTANISIDSIGEQGGFGVASVGLARMPVTFLAIRKRDSNRSMLKEPEKQMELDNL